MILRKFLFILLLLIGGAECSALGTGYYRIKSYSNKYLTENISNHALVCSDLSQTNYAQVWYLAVSSGSNVTLNNALTDRYIQKTTGNSWSEQYVTGKSSNDFTLAELTGNDSGKFTFTDKWEGGLHCDASSNVVLWLTSDDKSKWTVETVAIDADALATAQAQYNLALTTGYYRIKSNLYDNKYITENISNQMLVTSGSVSSLSQVWYISVDADEHTATIKNVLTDHCIQTQGTTSAQYSAGATAKVFVVGETKGSPNTYSFTDTGGRGLHCAATQSYNVVSWNSSADASIWQLEAVAAPTAEAIAAEKDALTEVPAAALGNFFTSGACTALKSPYSGYTDYELRSAMSELPVAVQNVAVKIKNNSWETYGTWDKTEQTFRIANYKAYSSHSRWTSILGYGHLMGRLSNPTGIWVDAGDILQLYVGAIPSGQTVKLEVAGHGQASGTLYDLHEGMNTMLASSSGNCFVFYEVDNTTDGAALYTALSSFADVTVHIEGGTVQGYFDLTRGDDDDDWAQLTTHLLSKENVCLKSSKHVMNLRKDWLTAALNGSSVVDMLTVWKNLSEWQDELTGRSDAYGGETTYGQYCNNLSSVTSVGGNEESGNPHATNYGTFYYDNYHSRIFNATSLLTVADNMWCIAHEQGHNRQAPINLVGNTEISNNLFSNLAIYKQGRFTSRTASVQAVFDDYLAGVSWPERVARSCNNVGDYNQQMLRLNWQLYMFFHINGNDPDFFPRLYDALRADPMTRNNVSVNENEITGGQFTRASDDYLKFYVKCCQVSGYDLTDFFASFGFFMIPNSASLTLGGITTTQYQLINDYNKTCLYVTQEMIDAAKKTVSDLSLPKANIAFIEDRVKAPLATYDGHTDGEKRQINSDAPVGSFGAVGEMGQYSDYDEACGPYRFNVSGRGNVTVEGTGAVGLILRDASDNIVGFYNTHTFRLPDSAFDENGLKSGYTLEAAAGDGKMTAASPDPSIEVNEFPKTGAIYTLCTPNRGGRFVTSTGADAGMNGQATATPTDDAMKWKFVQRSGETETFDIQNVKNSSYIDATATGGAQITSVSTKPEKGWKVKAIGNTGLYIIYSDGCQLHQANDNKIINWGGGSNTSDAGCQFRIEEVSALSTTVLEGIQGYTMTVSSDPANDIEAGKWYVMFDRGANHGYLYEKADGHTLYNTSTRPADGEVTADNAKYLVRLAETGTSNEYYLQTGFGNYFWQLQQSVNVATSATPSQPIKIGKIADTAGHFYLQASNGNIVLDANALTNGDATVVGYGNAAPTEVGGNNDWAFYPVQLQKTVTLNAVGDKSYATFYFDHDVQTDANTLAYYITSIENGSAQLTAVANEGHDIPANTAVVLISASQAASASLTPTSGLNAVVTQENNLLKGTLTSMSLDLGDATSYYSLGRKDGHIGFYKFQNGNTTTITLGANKAYLSTSASGGDVKGFRLDGDADAVNSLAQDEDAVRQGTANIVSLSGQRLRKPMRGVNIINRKKVVVR